MAKMKSVPSLTKYPAAVGLTSRLQIQASVPLISFLNAISSNFLNGFFMRPAPYEISQLY